MAITKYGQIVGNLCVDTISFDPLVTSVAEMSGTLGRTLLPIQDYLGGQWGVGATWDGITITQSGAVALDEGTLTVRSQSVQGQVDDLTNMVLAQTPTGTVQTLALTTSSSTATASGTFAAAFSATPRVTVGIRNASSTNYANLAEILAVSATGITVRSWQLRNATSGTNTGVLLGNAVINVIAYGTLA